MSAELITILSAFITLGIGMAASHAWMVRRIDTSIDSVKIEIDARFDKVDARFDKVDARFEKVDARFEKVDGRLESLARDITDLKVSVARWEGPRPHLLTAK